MLQNWSSDLVLVTRSTSLSTAACSSSSISSSPITEAARDPFRDPPGPGVPGAGEGEFPHPPPPDAVPGRGVGFALSRPEEKRPGVAMDVPSGVRAHLRRCFSASRMRTGSRDATASSKSCLARRYGSSGKKSRSMIVWMEEVYVSSSSAFWRSATRGPGPLGSGFLKTSSLPSFRSTTTCPWSVVWMTTFPISGTLRLIEGVIPVAPESADMHDILPLLLVTHAGRRAAGR
mmetsp:Transcript_5375/g.12990  ORF Transcript_5375/g.12990 Transcript_5375/m.12990 type:complete len:232 (-) Transcript_5375:14-709(-)